MIRRPLTLAICLALAACNQQAEQGKAAAASGEVLPGSISDDMIDLDTSTAAPPLAPVKPSATKKIATDNANDADSEEAEADVPAPAPAAESRDTE
ncbi:MAG: hypothetical protein B7Y74_03320 [Novosphingobium sp. 35-62-5]|uniref:hypothetical protein n=1 Tax=Novosphingobium sp. 17-62-19 TaxID=1970406 RepID=UPI000BCEA6D1|nr:hypothetical protein [Novosphingobium sp. 17-62-19]OYX95767.1 MAG: hypothetical protein B7Y74_03320 [Novosphingobium sp. 35-62-5]HQS96065.1 hypothetical protein [Novosphingobium sp.]